MPVAYMYLPFWIEAPVFPHFSEAYKQVCGHDKYKKNGKGFASLNGIMEMASITGSKHTPINEVMTAAKPMLVGTEVYWVMCMGIQL